MLRRASEIWHIQPIRGRIGESISKSDNSVSFGDIWRIRGGNRRPFQIRLIRHLRGEFNLFLVYISIFGVEIAKALLKKVKSTSLGPNWRTNRGNRLIQPTRGMFRGILSQFGLNWAKGSQNKVNSASSGPSRGTNRGNWDNSACLWIYLIYSGRKSIANGK
jgi:hypothetical protein